MRGAMTGRQQPASAEEVEDDNVLIRRIAKDRRCLRCETPFPSTWSGERICPSCKRSSTWRRGDPA